MAKKILQRAGTDAQRLGVTPDNRELFWATDTKRLYGGDGTTAGGILIGPISAGTTETFGYEAPAAISAAGNTNLTLGANDLRKTFDTSATGGAGIYTHTLTLQTTNAGAGDIAAVMVALPASANPTIEIRNATSGGTLLHSLNNLDAVASLLWSGEFVYTGAAWKLVRGAFHNA